MKKHHRLISLILTLTIVLTFCSCGLYDKEYISVSDYVIPEYSTGTDTDKVTVSKLDELVDAVGDLVNNGRINGTIVFAENYDGDVNSDLADACWKERSQDALCAYCVDNISYVLSKIVSYYEAEITISYADTGVSFNNIHKISYVTDIPNLISNALTNNDSKLVILVNRSGYNADNIIALIQEYYYKNPIVSPNEPLASVQIFSGTGYQKLYSIYINYLNADESDLVNQIKEMEEMNPFSIIPETDYDKIKAIGDYAVLNWKIGQQESVYDILINNSGNSKASALGVVALCNKLGLKSQIVEGQKNYTQHYWNIVEINGNNYHFDAYSLIELGGSSVILKTDGEMWNQYRWDTSSYPKCNTSLVIDET